MLYVNSTDSSALHVLMYNVEISYVGDNLSVIDEKYYLTILPDRREF